MPLKHYGRKFTFGYIQIVIRPCTLSPVWAFFPFSFLIPHFAWHVQRFERVHIFFGWRFRDKGASQLELYEFHCYFVLMNKDDTLTLSAEEEGMSKNMWISTYDIDSYVQIASSHRRRNLTCQAWRSLDLKILDIGMLYHAHPLISNFVLLAPQYL